MEKTFAYKITAFLFILPVTLLLLLYNIIPVLPGIAMSFMNIETLNFYGDFIGLDNFTAIFKDSIYWASMFNSLKLVACELLLALPVSFLLAVLMGHMTKRTRQFTKTFIFIPVVLSVSVTGLMWQNFLNGDSGVLNSLFGLLGLHNLQISWLGNETTSFYCVIFIYMWKYVGLNMLFFYAGIKSIPESYLEAAKVEGATNGFIIVRIILPLIKETTKFVCTLATIGTFGEIAHIMILTGGGPGYASFTVSYFIYSFGIQSSRYGMASAAAVIYAITVIIITVLLNRIFSKEQIQYN